MMVDRKRLIEATHEVVVGCCTTGDRSGAEMVDAILQDIAAQGFVVVPREPSFAVKMAGAEAITADHMKKMANYDAACDAWSAMITASESQSG